ncbi:MAG: SOS response-associated peptidase [Actinomycetia bacterium]|nr:SOS response-associated peptidase [Actinomycetes bacterium]
MCGRFFIQISKKDLDEIIATLERDNADREGLASLKLQGEIFPTDTVAVRTEMTYTAMRWGFTMGKGLVINARSETVMEKSLFRAAMAERRCAIAASGYYEWKQEETGRKTKYQFCRPGGKPLWLAGCYREEEGSPMPAFVILTREATTGLAQFHDRMPVVLSAQQADLWLAPGEVDLDDIISNSLTDLESTPA